MRLSFFAKEGEQFVVVLLLLGNQEFRMIFRYIFLILCNYNLWYKSELPHVTVIFLISINFMVLHYNFELIYLEAECFCYFYSQMSNSLEHANLYLFFSHIWSIYGDNRVVVIVAVLRVFHFWLECSLTLISIEEF